MSIETLARQLTEMRIELQEDNDYAEWKAEEDRKFQQALRMADAIIASRPRLVRDYKNDTVSVHVGDKKTFGGVK